MASNLEIKLDGTLYVPLVSGLSNDDQKNPIIKNIEVMRFALRETKIEYKDLKYTLKNLSDLNSPPDYARKIEYTLSITLVENRYGKPNPQQFIDFIRSYEISYDLDMNASANYRNRY